MSVFRILVRSGYTGCFCMTYFNWALNSYKASMGGEFFRIILQWSIVSDFPVGVLYWTCIFPCRDSSNRCCSSILCLWAQCSFLYWDRKPHRSGEMFSRQRYVHAQNERFAIYRGRSEECDFTVFFVLLDMVEQSFSISLFSANNSLICNLFSCWYTIATPLIFFS